MCIPATLGSVAGVLAAERIPGRGMALVITAAVMAALLLLVFKMKKVLEHPTPGVAGITPMGMFALLFVGFWMGFIVLDGATYLLLVLILMFHYDLIHANALKMLLAVATTLVPIAMFTGHGSIRWPEGLVMSAGSVAGRIHRGAAHDARTGEVLDLPYSGGGPGAGNYPPGRSIRTSLHSAASAARHEAHYFWRDSASASHPLRNSSGGTLVK